MRRKRRRGGDGEETIGDPRSTVRILQDPTELAEAITRAVAFEKAGTEQYRARLDRYADELRASKPVVVNLNPGQGQDDELSSGGDGDRLPA